MTRRDAARSSARAPLSAADERDGAGARTPGPTAGALAAGTRPTLWARGQLERHPARPAPDLATGARSPLGTRFPAVLALGALLGAACSSSARRGDRADDAPPFIRRARREQVLAIHWSRPLPSAGSRQIFGRALKDRLETAYRAPVRLESAEGPYPGLSPARLADWARAGIDDAVIVESEGTAQGAPSEARVRVIALATQDVLHDLRVPAPPSTSAGTHPFRRLAGAVYVAISRRWTAPGRAPAMDPLVAAHRLFEKQACAHAVPLYDIVIERSQPNRVDQIQRYATILERRRACRERLAIEARLARDRGATFALRVEAGGADREIVAAVRDRLDASGLTPALRERTNKPARLVVERQRLRLRMRHHAGQPGQPRLMPRRGGAAIDLDPLLPVMRALFDLKSLAASDLEGDQRLLADRLGFVLELEHLDGDYLAFELADLDRRAVISPLARLRVGGEQLRIRARDRDLLRRHLFLLGPLEGPGGRPTEDALVASFLRPD